MIPEQVGDDHGQFSRDYGDAIQLLIECGRGKFSIAAAHAWLAPPIALQQIRFDRGRGGRALGFMTWAHVDDDTLARLRADKVSLLELPEWNEGEHLWIVDIVAPRGGARRLVSALRRSLHPNVRSAYALRVDRPGRAPRPVTIHIRNR